MGILAVSIHPWELYHNIGCLKNQNGEVMDNQLQFITVELDKFHKAPEACKTDLEKLIYTMKMVNAIQEPIQYPQFWTEDWLKVALHELDTRNMTPEQRMHFEITLSNNAVAVQLEKKKMAEAKDEGKIEGKIEMAIIMKNSGESIEKIKQYTGLNENEINAL